MERVGVRELRQRASEILRHVAAGETFEVTDRGRPVAILSAPMPSGLAMLERQGLIRPARGDLGRRKPLPPRKGQLSPSELVRRAREE